MERIGAKGAGRQGIDLSKEMQPSLYLNNNPLSLLVSSVNFSPPSREKNENLELRRGQDGVRSLTNQ